LRSSGGHTLYAKTNEPIREVNIYNLKEMIVDYRCKRTRHLLNTNDTRITQLVNEYIATGRRDVGRQRKRRSDED
jgi:hypothetical protein